MTPVLTAALVAATKGTAALQSYWASLDKPDKEALLPHMDELKAQAAKADLIASNGDVANAVWRDPPEREPGEEDEDEGEEREEGETI